MLSEFRMDDDGFIIEVVSSGASVDDAEDLDNLCQILQEELSQADLHENVQVLHQELAPDGIQHSIPILEQDPNYTNPLQPTSTLHQGLDDANTLGDHPDFHQTQTNLGPTDSVVVEQELSETNIATNSELYLECHDDETNDLLLSEQIESLRKEREAEEAPHGSGMTMDIDAGSSHVYRISFPKHNDLTQEGRTMTKVACDLCRKTFARLSLCLDHKAVVHGIQNAFPCYLCSYTGQRYGHWYKHMRRMHPAAQAILPDINKTGVLDDTCTSTSDSLTALPLHDNSGISKDITTNDIVRVVSVEPNSNIRMMDESIEISETGERTMETCSVLQAGKKSKTDFYNKTQEPSNFQCPICLKIFSKSRSLLYHKRTHAAKTHACGISGCCKKFKNSSAMNEHRLTVHGEQIFKCSHEGCSKAYAVKRDLNYHQKSHTSVHACGVCGKRCRDKFNLLMHTKTHTKDRTFHCDQCEYTSIQCTALKLHKQKKHKDIATK